MFKEAKVIALLNNKGGVLKTSTIVNIAAVLAKKNKKVLILDADGQGNATLSFDLSEKEKYFEENQDMNVETLKYTIYDLLKLDADKMRTEDIMELINKTVIKNVFENSKDLINFNEKRIRVIKNKVNFLKRSQNKKEVMNPEVVSRIKTLEKEITTIILESESIKENSMLYGSIDILPANSNLQFFERELLNEMKKSKSYISNQKLKSVIKFLKNHYDFILIDSPPALGLIQENIMEATDYLIIPLELEFYAVQGISRVLSVYEELKRSNSNLILKAILPTKIKIGSNLHKTMYSSIKEFMDEEYSNLLLPFKEGINLSVRQASELAYENKPMVLTDWNKKTKHQNTISYKNLVEKYILK